MAKVLVVDIETSSLVVHTFGLFDQNIGLNQIEEDWHLLSFSAKWLGSDKVIYHDQSKQKDVRDDRHLCNILWDLLDEADIVVGQNSKKFDTKRINARFAINKTKKNTPPSSYRHIDTLIEARKHFSFTSNKLEYLLDKLCPGFKKYKSKDFVGFDLWKECIKGNPKAWKEMKLYNCNDVIGTEQLLHALTPWIKFNMNTYYGESVCLCGSKDVVKNGHLHTEGGKYQRYRCTGCGKESRDGINLLLTKEHRHSLRR